MQVQSEDFFEASGHPLELLERLRADVDVSLHGISLGLGNQEPPTAEYLAELTRLIDRLAPVRVSDHLCWTAWQRRQSLDLWPLPFVEDAIEHVVARIGRVQDRLRRQILVENVSSYVAFAASELSEVEFLCEVARRADCLILLDINNIVVNARNQALDPAAYVDAVPANRVAEIHLAGHTDHGDYLFDSHRGPVPEVVWDLYGRLVRRIGVVPTIVEWDTDIPPYEVVVAESARARGIADP